MNILVLGNGFDLAHGLPTKYTDFLYFCNAIKKVIESSRLNSIIPQKDSDYVEWINSKRITFSNSELDNVSFQYFRIKRLCKVSERDKKVYKEMFEKFIRKYFWEGITNQKWIKEILYLIYNNVWIEYFLESDIHGKDGWIDFESEISEVIQSIDKSMGQGNFYSIIIRLENEFFNNKYTNNVPEYLQATAEDQKKIKKPEITFKRLRDILLKDLEKLIRVFEIYLTKYVEKIEIGKKSPDIDALEIDFILSFNYTHTFSKLYDVSSRSKQEVADPFDYIHGETDINNTIVTNNMVLGIDEYLGDDRKNKDVEFIAFKKYYQRIHKQTGCKYKEWVEQISKEYDKSQRDRNEVGIEILKSIEDKSFDIDPFLPKKYEEKLQEDCPQHNMYIFGHSLDVTDKDILRDLILHDNVHTTIYYLNKDVMGQQIANLVKVIGQDELIKRTGGSTKTIEFKLQQDMIERTTATNQPL